MGYEFLKVSGTIAGETMAGQSFAPPSGSTVTIVNFQGNSYSSQNSVIRLVWNFGHVSEAEEQVWTIKGNDKMPIDKADLSNTISAATTANPPDGTRKLTLCCDNGDIGEMYMSGWAKVLVE